MNNTPLRKRLIRLFSIIFILIVIAILAFIIIAFIHGEFSSAESLKQYIDRFGAFAPAILIIIQMSRAIIPVIPGVMGCAAGSLMFGTFWGFIYNYIGITAGSIFAFLLAKKYGQPLLDDIFPDNSKFKRWKALAEKSKSYTAFLIISLGMPLLPDEYLCYLSGVIGISTKKFITIAILVKPWYILAYSFGFSFIG